MLLNCLFVEYLVCFALICLQYKYCPFEYNKMLSSFKLLAKIKRPYT